MWLRGCYGNGFYPVDTLRHKPTYTGCRRRHGRRGEGLMRYFVENPGEIGQLDDSRL